MHLLPMRLLPQHLAKHLLVALLLFGASACSSFPREMHYGQLASPAMGRDMDYAVYTPPDWSPAERLPLCVFLHGGGDNEDCFDRHGIAAHLDEAIAAGDAPRVVIVVPNGERGFWENFVDGSERYRDWVLDDLLPTVQHDYHTRTDRAGTHVFGISMGGHGTLRCALLEPERFASACAISAPVMDAEHLVEFTQQLWVRLFVPVERIWGPTDDVEKVKEDDLFERWRAQDDLRGLRVMLAYGTDDKPGIPEGNEHFHRHLLEHDVHHDLLVYPGAHRWVDWKPIFPAVLRWLRAGDAR